MDVCVGLRTGGGWGPELIVLLCVCFSMARVDSGRLCGGMQVLFVQKSVRGVAAPQTLQPLEDGNHRLVGEPGNLVVKENDWCRKLPPGITGFLCDLCGLAREPNSNAGW